MSRLSKDQDTLDTQLTMNAYVLLTTFSNVIGTVALVFYTFPYLGIIFAPLGVLYYLFVGLVGLAVPAAAFFFCGGRELLRKWFRDSRKRERAGYERVDVDADVEK